MAGYTTFGVGGAARWFAVAETESDVSEAVAWAEQRGVKLFLLGGGSNLLVPDEGFDGLVLRMGLCGVLGDGQGGFDVGAGESWDGFVACAVAEGCAGIECMAGIPGSVGGTPVQNVGAYGQEVATTIVSVRVFDRVVGEFVEMTKAECGFRYRESVFNTSARGRYIVTRVRFQLVPGGAPTLAYADLQKRFKSVSRKEREGEMHAEIAKVSVPGLREVAEVVREIRLSKGMLIVPGDADCRSAGSFFKNPIVGEVVLEQVSAAVGGGEVPHWAAGVGLVKLPAAWLLEKAGFVKG